MSVLNEVVSNGGPICIFLFFLWILGTAVIIERTLFWFELWRSQNNEEVDRALNYINKGDINAAKTLSTKSCNPIVRAVVNAAENIAIKSNQNMGIATDELLEGVDRYIRILNACSVIAPAAGLLGTVIGMIKAFGTMSKTVDMSLIANGISTAMVTTFCGLLVAIVCLTASHFFGGLANSMISKLEGKLNEIKIG